MRAQNYFFDFWAWEGILIPPSCVRSQSHDGKLDFLAKIATKNRQNRQLAEFRETYYTKLVEHQILIEKMVCQKFFYYILHFLSTTWDQHRIQTSILQNILFPPSIYPR